MRKTPMPPRTTPLRSTSPQRSRPGGTPKRKPRKPSEFQRVYGGRSRVAWVKSLPCIVCHARPCENAHIVTGGMGRKADADQIVPLCPFHHWESHVIGIKTFAELHRVDLAWYAAATEGEWRARSHGAAKEEG